MGSTRSPRTLHRFEGARRAARQLRVVPAANAAAQASARTDESLKSTGQMICLNSTTMFSAMNSAVGFCLDDRRRVQGDGDRLW